MARDVRRQPFDRRQTLRTTAPHLLAPSGIMKYDIQTLKVFVTVSQEGSIAKAAAKEHTVASAVSKRISELEKSIGADLFYRHRRGVKLTQEEIGRASCREGVCQYV